MRVIWALLGVVLIAVLLGFSVYNAQERVAVNILNTRYINVPLIYVTYWAFIFGMVLSFIVLAKVLFRQAAELRRTRKSVSSLNGEISALRNRPIEESPDKFLQSGKEDGK